MVGDRGGRGFRLGLTKVHLWLVIVASLSKNG